MKYDAVIRMLRVEVAKIDHTVATLQALADGDRAPKPASRHGRRAMDAKERQEVSERMQNYWAARRRERKGR